MRKNRRGIREDGAHDLELADVNEQELAKAVEDGKRERSSKESSDKTLKEEEKQNDCLFFNDILLFLVAV